MEEITARNSRTENELTK